MICIGSIPVTYSLLIHAMFGGVPVMTSTIIYQYTQTWLSYRLIPFINTLRMARIRLFCTILAILSSILLVISAGIMIYQINDFELAIKMLDPVLRLNWDRSIPGYSGYTTFAVFEALLFLSATPFFASFVNEFKRINLINREFIFNKVE